MSSFSVTYATGSVPVTIISIHERVNMSNSAELEKIARDEYEKGMRNLILDLSEMPSITSSGLRSIIVIYKLLANYASTKDQPALKKPSHLKLLQPSNDVRYILEIAGMNDRLEIFEDLQTAVASFS